MGQIVQYGHMTYKREKTLKWNDKHKHEESKPNNHKTLARIIPIKDTLNFSYQVVTHHEKSTSDVKPCLRGGRLNKYNKS